MQLAHDVAGLALLIIVPLLAFDAYEWHIERRARARTRARVDELARYRAAKRRRS